MNPHNFFAELKRRNVYKVAITYAVVAWLLIQAASILLPTFEAPNWVMKAFVVLLAFGFVMSVMISWAFEATPEGLKRTKDVSPEMSPPIVERTEVCRLHYQPRLDCGRLVRFPIFATGRDVSPRRPTNRRRTPRRCVPTNFTKIDRGAAIAQRKR